jgi:hypothetical protein
VSSTSVGGSALMALPNNYTSGLISNNLFLAEPAALRLLECRGARSAGAATSPCCINVGRLYPGRADNKAHRRRAHAAVTATIRRAIDEDRFPHALRLDPLRAALGKLDAALEPTPLPKDPPPAKADRRSPR